MPPMAVTMREIPGRMCGSRLVDYGQLDPGDVRLWQEISLQLMARSRVPVGRVPFVQAEGKMREPDFRAALGDI